MPVRSFGRQPVTLHGSEPVARLFDVYEAYGRERFHRGALLGFAVGALAGLLLGGAL